MLTERPLAQACGAQEDAQWLYRWLRKQAREENVFVYVAADIANTTERLVEDVMSMAVNAQPEAANDAMAYGPSVA